MEQAVHTSVVPHIQFATPCFSPLSSSSSSSQQFKFIIKFILRDFITSSSSFDIHGHRYETSISTSSEIPQQTSSPIVTLFLVPTDYHCWDNACSALALLGLQPEYHNDVINPLRTQVQATLAANFRYVTEHQCAMHVDVSVDIQPRTDPITVPPIPFHTYPTLDQLEDYYNNHHHVMIDEVNTFDNNDMNFVQDLIAIDDLMIFDHQHHNNDYDVDDNQETMTMMRTPCITERVVDISDWKTLEGKECAVCFEQFQQLLSVNNNHDDDDRIDDDGDREVARLPCKHVFHESCILNWFNKSHFCPLCRHDCSQQPSS